MMMPVNALDFPEIFAAMAEPSRLVRGQQSARHARTLRRLLLRPRLRPGLRGCLRTQVGILDS